MILQSQYTAPIGAATHSFPGFSEKDSAAVIYYGKFRDNPQREVWEMMESFSFSRRATR
jgi:hypothetical protein